MSSSVPFDFSLLRSSRSWNLCGVRLLDPLSQRDETGNLYCKDGLLTETPVAGAPMLDATGRSILAMPAAIDVHVHFREPGNTAAECVATGLAAAAAGGVGTVVVMPNTTPALDTPEALEEQRGLAEAAEEKRVRLLCSACCTKERAGNECAPLMSLAMAGAVAFTDDGAMVSDENVMREVMRQAAMLGLPVMDHAVVPEIAKKGVVRKELSNSIPGAQFWPEEAELEAVKQDLRLAAETGVHIHLQHLSSGKSVPLIAQARAARVKVSAEATPHHLLLCSEEIPGDDANWKMNPPLGSARDRAQLRAGVLSGVIDCFATDHAPHLAEAKKKTFQDAPFGVIGLETALPATWLAMVQEAGMEALFWARAWTLAPAAVLRLPPPSLSAGAPARITLLEETPWTPTVNDLRSRSVNSPFLNRTYPIRVLGLL